MSPFSISLHEFRQIMLHRRLRHPEGEAAIDGDAHRDLVDEAAIDADDRDRAEVAAAMDCLAKHMGTIGPEKGGRP